MSDWPTDEMVKAADLSWPMPDTCLCGTQWEGLPEDCSAALTAALDAAPKVDGWVWCGKRSALIDVEHGWVTERGAYETGGCPGPHRTLIIGPEVPSG